MALAEQIEGFREDILEGGILDPNGIHHEFVSGAHGQKLDFDLIPTYKDGSSEDNPDLPKKFFYLYEKWISTAARFIQEEFPRMPEVILGVANGTNRVAKDVAIVLSELTDEKLRGYATEKDKENEKILWLPEKVEDKITKLAPELVVVIEDVGTTGSQSVQVAQQAIGAGANRVVVVPTWQRQERLARLDEAGIEYRSIIHEPLPTYSPDDCVKTGFCSQGWGFIARSK